MKSCIGFLFAFFCGVAFTIIVSVLILNNNPQLLDEFRKDGFTPKSFANRDKIADLSVDCSGLVNLLALSELNVIVSNKGSKEHHNITVRIVEYDKNGNEIAQTNTTFKRSLAAYSNFAKIVNVKGRTRRCNCIIEDSNPQ